MFPNKFKPYKGRLFNASFGAILSMQVSGVHYPVWVTTIILAGFS